VVVLVPLLVLTVLLLDELPLIPSFDLVGTVVVTLVPSLVLTVLLLDDVPLIPSLVLVDSLVVEVSLVPLFVLTELLLDEFPLMPSLVLVVPFSLLFPEFLVVPAATSRLGLVLSRSYLFVKPEFL
jgi:hypothetical protein